MSDRSSELIYGNRARYYDLIYQWKDYGAEATHIRALLQEEGIRDGSRVLEAACGTGTYLLHLRSWYDIAGFDLSPELIAIAREKLGARPMLFEADMASFTVVEPCDAIICLFSSIGYVYPEQRLRAAVSRFHAALRPGGVLIVEPWFDPKDYRPGVGELQTVARPGIKACRASVATRDGEMAVHEFTWLIVDWSSQRVEHFKEAHRLWLCPHTKMKQIFEAGGFTCRFIEDGLMPGRSLFIARR